MNSIKDLLKEECREFWIERKSFSSHVLAAWDEKPDEITYRIAKDVIHVIEASYAHRLKEALENIQSTLDELIKDKLITQFVYNKLMDVIK